MTPENARRPYQDIVEFMLTKLSDSGVLTDMAPGSVARTMVEATAREFSELYARMNAVYDAGFIDTATGASLDQLVALVGITRIDGEAQVAEATLTRDSRISARVIIPIGTEIAATRAVGDKVIYAVDDDYELIAGESSVSVAIRALPSADQTAEDVALSPDDAANGILTQVSPIAGIAGLKLDGPSASLGVRETDDALRNRAKMAIASAGGGTAKALENALMSIPNVAAVELRDASDLDENGQPIMPPGELEVVLDIADSTLEELEDEITAAIEAHKGPGILARVRKTNVNVLSGSITIRPASNALTGAQMIKLVDDCNTFFTDAVSAVGIGETLVWNRVLAGFMGIENVADVIVGDSEFFVTRTDTAPDTAANPIQTHLSPPNDIALKAFTRLELGTGTQAVAIKLVEMPLATLDVALDFDLQEPVRSDVDMIHDTAIKHLDTLVDELNALAPALERPVDLTRLIGLLTGADGLLAPYGAAITPDMVRLNVIDMKERTEVPLTGTNTLLNVPAGTLVTLAQEPVIITWKPDTP